jgi:hypothetical protein
MPTESVPTSRRSPLEPPLRSDVFVNLNPASTVGVGRELIHHGGHVLESLPMIWFADGTGSVITYSEPDIVDVLLDTLEIFALCLLPHTLNHIGDKHLDSIANVIE